MGSISWRCSLSIATRRLCPRPRCASSTDPRSPSPRSPSSLQQRSPSWCSHRASRSQPAFSCRRWPPARVSAVPTEPLLPARSRARRSSRRSAAAGRSTCASTPPSTRSAARRLCFAASRG
eukprot:Amastigsp_a174834_32.p5 type:complete len:121 gc:universal Amastigsp_a174834_32:401-39(-)